MPPTLLIELDARARRRPGRVLQIARIACGTGHPGGVAETGMHAVPWHVGVILAYPANVLAEGATHQANNSAPACVNFT